MIIFRVRSHSNPKKYYTVTITHKGVWHCECIGFWSLRRRGRHDCRHVKACQEALVGNVQRMYYDIDNWKPKEGKVA